MDDVYPLLIEERARNILFATLETEEDASQYFDAVVAMLSKMTEELKSVFEKIFTNSGIQR